MLLKQNTTAANAYLSCEAPNWIILASFSSVPTAASRMLPRRLSSALFRRRRLGSSSSNSSVSRRIRIRRYIRNTATVLLFSLSPSPQTSLFPINRTMSAAAAAAAFGAHAMYTTTVTAATTTMSVASDFFVLARDRGTIRDDLPSWASRSDNPFQLVLTQTTSIVVGDDDGTCNNTPADSSSANNYGSGSYCADVSSSSSMPRSTAGAERKDVDGVPGTFQI